MLATNVFALIMILSPVDAEIPGISAEGLAQVQLSLITTALQLQIIDPYEVPYFFMDWSDFRADLIQLRGRYHDLRTAPLIEEALRFPDSKTLADWLYFNRSYRRELETRQLFDQLHWGDYQTVLEETDRLHAIWDWVRVARNDDGYIPLRRRALERLRELLGPEDYYNGRLPPIVPTWRFHMIN